MVRCCFPAAPLLALLCSPFSRASWPPRLRLEPRCAATSPSSSAEQFRTKTRAGASRLRRRARRLARVHREQGGLQPAFLGLQPAFLAFFASTFLEHACADMSSFIPLPLFNVPMPSSTEWRVVRAVASNE